MKPLIKIIRDKSIFEKKTNNASCSTKDQIIFTRTGTVLFDKKLCFFCQSPSDEKGRSRLNEAETIETGCKISEAVKNGDSDNLKVRLSNAIQNEDGIYFVMLKMSKTKKKK